MFYLVNGLIITVFTLIALLAICVYKIYKRK